MKKLLLATAIAAVASSAYAEENDFYVRADVGASWMQKQNAWNQKGKRDSHVVGDLGVGMYLMDNVRSELTLSHHFNAKQKFTGTDSTGTQYRDTVKARALSVSLKGLVDVFDYGYGKVFLGAGVGYTQLNAKITETETFAGNSVTDHLKAKKKNNVNFLGTAGVSFDVSEGVMLDVAYQYNDYGKTKNFTHNGVSTGSKYHFRTHDLTAGIRVDL